MTRLAWYKRYPADFREGTRKLSFEERGFYGDVLDLIYESGNALADDDAANAHQLHADLRTFRRLKARLIGHGKLYVGDGMLRNARADAEAVAAATRIALARDHGKLGGEKSRKSVTKVSNFNGSGGAGAKAGARPDAEPVSGIREEEVIESTGDKTESVTTPTPPADAGRGARAVLWSEVKAFLGGTNPGAVIGKWCRDYGEGAFLEAYFAARREGPADPTSRIAGMLKARSKKAGGMGIADKIRAQLAAEGITLQ